MFIVNTLSYVVWLIHLIPFISAHTEPIWSNFLRPYSLDFIIFINVHIPTILSYLNSILELELSVYAVSHYQVVSPLRFSEPLYALLNKCVFTLLLMWSILSMFLMWSGRSFQIFWFRHCRVKSISCPWSLHHAHGLIFITIPPYPHFHHHSTIHIFNIISQLIYFHPHSTKALFLSSFHNALIPSHWFIVCFPRLSHAQDDLNSSPHKSWQHHVLSAHPHVIPQWLF